MRQALAQYGLFFIYRSLGVPLIYFIPVILEEKGITGWQSGFLLGLVYVAGILVSIPAGHLNDRRDSSRLIPLSLLATALFSFTLVPVDKFGTLVFLFIVLGIGRNLFQVSFDAMFFRSIIRGRGCIHAGRYQAAFSLAAFSGLGVTAVFFHFIDISYLYTFLGFLLLLGMYPAFQVKGSVPSAEDRAAPSRSSMTPQFFGFLVIIFLFSLHFGAEDACYGLFLKHYLKVTPDMSALYMMAESLTFGSAALAIGYLVDRYGFSLRKIFILGIMISGATLVLKVNPDYFFSMGMRMLHGIGDAMVLVVIYFGLSRVFRIETMGGSSGILAGAMMFGSFAGAVIFSRIGSLKGYEISFIVCGILLIVTSLLLGVFNRFIKAAPTSH